MPNAILNGITVNGTDYDIADSQARADVAELKSAIDYSVTYVDLFDDLIMGSLNTNTGAIQTSSNRCVNKEIREYSASVLCTSKTGYEIYILQYNDDSTVTILSTWTGSYLLPANTKVRFMVRKSNNANLTVEEAETNTFGKADSVHRLGEQVQVLEQDVEEISDRFSCVNLFDNTWEKGSISSQTGANSSGDSYRTAGYIPVKPNTKYTLQNEVGDPYLVGLIYEYRSDKTFIRLDQDTSASIYTFTTSETTYFVRFRTRDVYTVTLEGAENAKYMLHIGEGKVNFLQYGRFSMSEGFSLGIEDGIFNSFNLACNYFDYGKNAKSNDGTTGSRFDADNLTAQDVYDAYDALVANHSEYVTKVDLGMDESDTYHLYSYTFRPPLQALINANTGTAIDSKPNLFQKIIITTGTHGDGEGGDKTDSIISTYNLMKALCDDYAGNPALTFIRMNVEVIVVPCVNPWGITNKSRTNSNGVDINRNFDAGWSSSIANSGASAASESETQILQELFDNNDDALAHVEVHTRGGSTWAQTSITFISELSINSDLRYVMQLITAYLKNKFNATGSVNADMSMHGMITDYSLKSGIQSVLLECAFMAFSSEASLHSAEIDRRNTEFVSDTVIKSLQWFIYHPKIDQNV